MTLRFPIVGIGASAGGVEALEQFFTTMPAENGMAFVVVTHLDPHHESRLPEIIGRRTTMPVT
ncbi:MAG: chemotaxis protein CheB, partial [Stellaceae bacterium]